MLYPSQLHTCRHPYLRLVKEDRQDKGFEQAGAQMDVDLMFLENFLGKSMKGASVFFDPFPDLQCW